MEGDFVGRRLEAEILLLEFGLGEISEFIKFGFISLVLLIVVGDDLSLVLLVDFETVAEDSCVSGCLFVVLCAEFGRELRFVVIDFGGSLDVLGLRLCLGNGDDFADSQS